MKKKLINYEIVLSESDSIRNSFAELLRDEKMSIQEIYHYVYSSLGISSSARKHLLGTYMCTIMDSPRKEELYDNMDDILEDLFSTNGSLLNSGLLGYIENDNPEMLNKLFPKFVKNIFRMKRNDEQTGNTLLSIEISDMQARLLSERIKDAAFNTSGKLSDLTFVRSEKYFDLYKIGNRLIKFGNEKFKEPTVESDMFVKPVYQFPKAQEGDCGYFELIDGVIPIELDRITWDDSEQIVYDVYRDFKSNNQVWADPRIENVGYDLRTKKYVVLNPESVFSKEEYENEKEKIGQRYGLFNYDRMEKIYAYEQEKFKALVENQLLHSNGQPHEFPASFYVPGLGIVIPRDDKIDGVR